MSARNSWIWLISQKSLIFSNDRVLGFNSDDLLYLYFIIFLSIYLISVKESGSNLLSFGDELSVSVSLSYFDLFDSMNLVASMTWSLVILLGSLFAFVHTIHASLLNFTSFYYKRVSILKIEIRNKNKYFNFLLIKWMASSSFTNLSSFSQSWNSAGCNSSSRG